MAGDAFESNNGFGDTIGDKDIVGLINEWDYLGFSMSCLVICSALLVDEAKSFSENKLSSDTLTSSTCLFISSLRSFTCAAGSTHVVETC